MSHHLLILGGTTEARQLAGALAARGDLTVTMSLAGRTQAPVAQPVRVRLGGFGGATGLAAHLTAERVDLLVDATHPFAARMSEHAVAAAAVAGCPLLALRRPPWTPGAGDRWREVAGLAAALGQIGPAPKRLFLAMGRQELGPVVDFPQHRYLVRSVDPIVPPLAVPDVRYIQAVGPFAAEDETRLMREYRIDAVIAKNSGGSAAAGKLAAARTLGLPVYMFARPALPPAPSVADVPAALTWIDHWRASGTARAE
ncbi:MAG: cobalt-precorrin-6A reductase [Pseudomonadota bacterium]|nr:cobalt-precorrin-6A reductase [Pseudomonadota bacterium]